MKTKRNIDPILPTMFTSVDKRTWVYYAPNTRKPWRIYAPGDITKYTRFHAATNEEARVAYSQTLDVKAAETNSATTRRPKQCIVPSPALQLLSKLAHQRLTEQYPGVNLKRLPRFPFSDNDRSNLTRSIIDFLNLSGYWACNPNRNHISRESKSLPDVLGVCSGHSIAVAIEIGKDLPSEAQRIEMVALKENGAHCLFASDFEGFIEWFRREFQIEPFPQSAMDLSTP